MPNRINKARLPPHYFIPTSIHDIFKSDGLHHTSYAGLLIGHGQKVKFRGIFRGKFAEKSTDFAGIFRANLAENQSVKKGRLCGYFRENFVRDRLVLH